MRSRRTRSFRVKSASAFSNVPRSKAPSDPLFTRSLRADSTSPRMNSLKISSRAISPLRICSATFDMPDFINGSSVDRIRLAFFKYENCGDASTHTGRDEDSESQIGEPLLHAAIESLEVCSKFLMLLHTLSTRSTDCTSVLDTETPESISPRTKK